MRINQERRKIFTQIEAERNEQIKNGYTLDYDTEQGEDALAKMATSYLLGSLDVYFVAQDYTPGCGITFSLVDPRLNDNDWPGVTKLCKKLDEMDNRTRLVKAAAMIFAAIEVLDRKAGGK